MRSDGGHMNRISQTPGVDRHCRDRARVGGQCSCDRDPRSRCPRAPLPRRTSYVAAEPGPRAAPRWCRSWRWTMAGQPREPRSMRRRPAPAAAGKPVDDIAFVRQATESGRKEVQSARDALLQLKQPGIETHRRNAGERSQRRECAPVEDRRGQALAAARSADRRQRRRREPRAAISTRSGPRR